jgi:hypothetical protein
VLMLLQHVGVEKKPFLKGFLIYCHWHQSESIVSAPLVLTHIIKASLYLKQDD